MPNTNGMVTVVCETKYYVTRGFGPHPLQLLKTADTNLMWEVYGIVLEVVRPQEHAGQVVCMHHDGVLASGDPFRMFEIGKRYQFDVRHEDIGRFQFGICSVVWPCKKVSV